MLATILAETLTRKLAKGTDSFAVLTPALVAVVALAAGLVVGLTLGCSDDKTENPNLEPTASFTVNPASGPLETVFEFDALGSSDPEDSTADLEVRWDWDNDGSWNSDWSPTKTATHHYSTTGPKIVRLQVRDTAGATDDTTRTVTVTGSQPVPGTMILVPSGNFTQGDGVAYCGADQRQVLLNRPFYLGQCEVTNQEYRDLLQWAYDQGHITATETSVRDDLDGSSQLLVDLSSGFMNIAFSGGVFSVASGYEQHPVTSVNWYGAAAYCDWLSMHEGLAREYDHATWLCNGGDPYSAYAYRLPTDAEWEYAAQYNDGRIFPWGNEALDCTRSNSTGCAGHPDAVGSYPAGVSALGFYDMTGNVWEWCNDWEVCDLGTEPAVDPVGPASGDGRVVHGGSFTHVEQYSRRAGRISYSPGSCYSYGGFRIARSHPLEY